MPEGWVSPGDALALIAPGAPALLAPRALALLAQSLAEISPPAARAETTPPPKSYHSFPGDGIQGGKNEKFPMLVLAIILSGSGFPAGNCSVRGISNPCHMHFPGRALRDERRGHLHSEAHGLAPSLRRHLLRLRLYPGMAGVPPGPRQWHRLRHPTEARVMPRQAAWRDKGTHDVHGGDGGGGK